MNTISIRVKRSQNGFGLSLVFRGLDKYAEPDTGIFVSKVLTGGPAERAGLRENDRIISINNMSPRTVEDAVTIIRDAGKHVQVEVLRDHQNISRGSKARSSVSQHNFSSINNSYFDNTATQDRNTEVQTVRRGQVKNPGYGNLSTLRIIVVKIFHCRSSIKLSEPRILSEVFN